MKEVVRKATNSERAGLMLGLAEMGGNEGFWIGAFYPVGTNMIVMNKTPLRKIVETNPKLFNAYCFHILLHSICTASESWMRTRQEGLPMK